MKSLVFDTSTIISIATNNLLYILKELKRRFNGQFLISNAVKEEVILTPLKSKRFKLEAMQILSLVAEKIIIIHDSLEIRNQANHISNLANSIFSTNGKSIKIIQKGEAEAIALSIKFNSTLAVDERTTRILLENPKLLQNLLSSKTHANISLNQKVLDKLNFIINKIPIIRSTELMVAAYDLNLLNSYLNPKEREIVPINLKKSLLDGLLWGLRLRGCAISTYEINEIIKIKEK